MKPSKQVDLAQYPSPSAGRGLDRLRSRLSAFPVGLRASILGGSVAITLGLALFLPVHFPSVVNTYASIAPTHRWVLAKGTDGRLVASTFNYQFGLSEGFRVSTFNPGGSVVFSLDSSLAPGRMVAVGDTIGSIYSSEVDERLITLNGRLAAARGLLAVNSSGQKSAIVEAAEQRLKFAERRREEHQKIEERTQLLFDQHLIAQGEYDHVQSDANALEDEISIAQANLEAARTGAKPEQVNLANANIAAIESEIEALRGRAATHTLTAPISGTITPTFSGDTLVTITATEYVALIPIRLSDYERVAKTPEAHLTLQGLSQTVTGTVIATNRELHVVHGKEVLIATAQLDAQPIDVMSGMIARCRIHCTPLTAIEYGKQFIKSAAGSLPLLGGFQ